MQKEKRIMWTISEIRMIRELYANISTQELAKIIGKSDKSVMQKAHRLGLSKTKEHLRRMKQRVLSNQKKQEEITGVCRYKVLNRYGEWEDWTGNFQSMDAAQKWYNLYGKFHEMRGKRLKLFPVKNRRKQVA